MSADGLAYAAHVLAGWLAPALAVLLILAIPWLMGWLAMVLS